MSTRTPKDWGRLLTAMVTPFDRNGNLNEAEAARIATYLVDVQKNDGIVVAGTTGESPTLSVEEKLRLLKITIEAVGDRATVVFGAGTYNTAESIHLTKEGERLGADGIMLVNPYYSRPGQEGLYAHFSTVAGATGLPVLLYNIQPRSAINLDTETLARLWMIPNIVGVKEASGNMAQIQEVARRKPDSFRIYSGDDALTLPILSVGGHGVVSVAGHVVGAEIKALLDHFPSDVTAARKLHLALLPVYSAVFSAPNPVPVKWLLSKLGFDCSEVRLPLVQMSPGHASEVERIFADFKSLQLA